MRVGRKRERERYLKNECVETRKRTPNKLTETDDSKGSLLRPGQVDCWAHLKLAKDTSTCQSVRETACVEVRERKIACVRALLFCM